MKIFDCFTFHNELDLLELRLKEHWDYVDYFVISEANLTHQGARPKNFYLADNWERFKPFKDKIIHVKVDDMPDDPLKVWQREHYQRNSLKRGLSLADPDDIICVSDCDELLRPTTWNTIRNDQDHTIWGSKAHTFNFKFNYVLMDDVPHRYGIFNMAVRAKERLMPQEIRDLRVTLDNRTDAMIIEHGGWHFSFLGDTKFVREKINNWAHQEFSYIQTYADVNLSIQLNRGIDPRVNEPYRAVLLDEYFPTTVLENPSQWEKYIISNDNLSSIANLFV